MRLVDESILRFREDLESDADLPEDRYNFLSYLLSREALSLKCGGLLCDQRVMDIATAGHYAHRWRKADVVLWDNVRVTHTSMLES